jgi:hypothetical protein
MTTLPVPHTVTPSETKDDLEARKQKKREKHIQQDFPYVQHYLPLVNGASLQLTATINGTKVTGMLDCGATYRYANYTIRLTSSQLPVDLATNLGLESHEKVLGHSSIGNALMKVDYLTKVVMEFGGVTNTMVIKVGPDQPVLFGLDFLCSWGLIVDYSCLCIYMQKDHTKISSSKTLKHLDWDQILRKLAIKQKDLVPIETLPAPKESYDKLIQLGAINQVIDLGASFRMVYCSQYAGIYCGVSK